MLTVELFNVNPECIIVGAEISTTGVKLNLRVNVDLSSFNDEKLSIVVSVYPELLPAPAIKPSTSVLI